LPGGGAEIAAVQVPDGAKSGERVGDSKKPGRTVRALRKFDLRRLAASSAPGEGPTLLRDQRGGMEVSTHAHIDSSTTVPVPTSVARDARGTERQNGIRRLGIALLAALALFAFQLVSAHSASADTGIPCPQAGTETVATDSPAYQGGETAHITGSGYSIGCDVTV
jgi:hypothetical protein